MKTVKTGLEVLAENPPKFFEGKRLGVLANMASVDSKFRFTKDIIAQLFPNRLKVLCSPQHGYFGAKQDNMIESEHIVDPVLNVPIYSLYSETRIPSKEMFEPLDILIVDLQDAGTRVYTFVYTMAYCMEVAAKTGKKVVVLDRPNPVCGDRLEGNCLEPEYKSFVGRYPIPMRHGLTIGELACLFNNEYGIGCDLEIIKMQGWSRDMYYQDTGLTWVAPSPNLPTPFSALVYPGQVIWEATNVSEGRGTTQPFEIFGAPYIDPEKIKHYLGNIDGIYLRSVCFEPTFNKWHGKLCRGFQIHVTERNLYEPYFTTLKILRSIFLCYNNEFKWKNPPYEYEFVKLPIDIVLGCSTIRKSIEQGDPIEEIKKTWEPDLQKFIDMSRKYQLYGKT